MSIVQAILLGLVYLYSCCSFGNGFTTTYRPLIGGFFAGLILGDPVTGATVGATVNLIFLGFISAGGSTAGDMALSGILCSVMAITAGLSTEAALAFAAPISVIGTFPYTGYMTIDAAFVHMMDKWIEEDKPEMLKVGAVILPLCLKTLFYFVPMVIICYTTPDLMIELFSKIPGWLTGALYNIGGVLPAVGVAINLRAIYKGTAKPFLFLGFILAAFFKLPTIGIAMLALIAAILVIQYKNEGKAE